MYVSAEWSYEGDIFVNMNGIAAPSVNSACYGKATVKLTDDFGNVYTKTVTIIFTKNPATAITVTPSEYITHTLGESSAHCFGYGCRRQRSGSQQGNMGIRSPRNRFG